MPRVAAVRSAPVAVRRALVVVVLTVATTSLALGSGTTSSATARTHSTRSSTVWPQHGQAAYALGQGSLHTSAHPRMRPIASVAKIMTAVLVLRSAPLVGHSPGFVLTVHRRDVRDRARRVARGESTVPVRAGERLTERQALQALLLPSANNIAIMLARHTSATVHAFVHRMNAVARRTDMHRTVYTDPSGFDPRTRSVPADQVRLAMVAMAMPFLRRTVDRHQADLPVAGRVRNTDTLLGHDGFVGIKTGSMTRSGGCFLFRSYRSVHGRTQLLTGIVMGQPGPDLLRAGLTAARRLVDRVAPHAAGSG